MLLHLHIISGCFCTTWAELSSCSRDRMACRAQNIYILSLYRKISLLLGIYYKKVSRVTVNGNCQHLTKSCLLSYSRLLAMKAHDSLLLSAALALAACIARQRAGWRCQRVKSLTGDKVEVGKCCSPSSSETTTEHDRIACQTIREVVSILCSRFCLVVLHKLLLAKLLALSRKANLHPEMPYFPAHGRHH